MIKKSQLIVQFKAGDCAFFDSKRPGGGPSLASEGHLEYANAPNDFLPDLHKLSRDPGSLAAVARAIEDYDDSQLRILMHVLDQSARLQRFDLKFGEVVYKALGNDMFLDGWFRCYVVGLGPMIENTQYVKLCGSLDNVGGTLITCPLGSFQTAQMFRPMYRKMSTEGALVSPRNRHDRVLRHNKPDAAMERLPSIETIKAKLESAPSVQPSTSKRVTRAASARTKLAGLKSKSGRRTGAFTVNMK